MHALKAKGLAFLCLAIAGCGNTTLNPPPSASPGRLAAEAEVARIIARDAVASVQGHSPVFDSRGCPTAERLGVDLKTIYSGNHADLVGKETFEARSGCGNTARQDGGEDMTSQQVKDTMDEIDTILGR